MKESELERIFVEEVRKENGRAYKWISPGNDGVPDRIVIFPGAVYFVELKTDHGRVTAQQKIQHKKLIELEQDVTILKGMSGMISFFEKIGKHAAAGRLKGRYGGDAR